MWEPAPLRRPASSAAACLACCARRSANASSPGPASSRLRCTAVIEPVYRPEWSPTRVSGVVRVSGRGSAPSTRGSGAVRGREVVSIVPQSELSTVTKGAAPASGRSRVETLRGDDYVRVWINRGGTHYLVHLVPA